MPLAAYAQLEVKGAALAAGLIAAAAEAGVPVQLNRVGSMLTVFFTSTPVTDAATARLASGKRFAAFFHALLENGVYFPPSQFESAFLSTAHSEADLDLTLRAAKLAFAAAAKIEA
jgi:glutamate-1-semialdehyde 2,1-aminomutase